MEKTLEYGNIAVGTGRSRCAVCENAIPRGTCCVHLRVNSRAAPFICEDCLEKLLNRVKAPNFPKRRWVIRNTRGNDACYCWSKVEAQYWASKRGYSIVELPTQETTEVPIPR